MPFFTHLQCSQCGRRVEKGPTALICDCGASLLARYDLERIAATLTPEVFARRRRDLWRYQELLPLDNPSAVVSLGEGMTPLLSAERLGRDIGLPNLMLKDESLNPTGTFKARGAAVGVSMVRQFGATAIGVPTAGNAGGAWASYAARAGLACSVVMPYDAQPLMMTETTLAGADTYLVNGLINDAGRMIERAATAHGWFNAATMKEPYRVEGKKTMGLEIVEQLGWQLPDAILYPTGGGVGIIAIYKALQELKALGWITGDFPRLIAVQAEGCRPVVDAVARQATRCQAPAAPHTIAGGLRVPKPFADHLVLSAIYDTDGTAVAVSDDDMIAMMRTVCKLEGLFICPEGAAAVVAAAQLRAAGLLKQSETVVVLNTGSGIKYADLVAASPPRIEPDQAI